MSFQIQNNVLHYYVDLLHDKDRLVCGNALHNIVIISNDTVKEILYQYGADNDILDV